MKRESVNRIRYILEELLPPFVRDSRFMKILFRLHWGTFVDDLEKFRTNITSISAEHYRHIYERMPRIQDETDNSFVCLQAIAELVIPGAVCDVGCGTGYLIGFLKERENLRRSIFTGVDFLVDPSVLERRPDVSFVSAPIEKLPFPDRSFETVICTHVLEHILDIRAAMSELRRVTARRLIVVVPLEREHLFTFNPHIHFFPYPHSFLRHIIPVPASHELKVLGRDLLYTETMGA